MVWLYILIAVVTFIFCIWTIFHMPRLGCFNLVTGGVKCGKSMFSVWLVRKKYKRAMLRWFWNCIKAKITRKPLPERPLVYSNIPLRIPYVPFTTMNALRKKRFRYGSVLFIDEASLFSDSQLIKDEDRNLQLMLFNKLIGHELHGGSGTIIYNTQCIQDLHYSIRRCLSNFIYCEKVIKIPFFVLLFYRDATYSEDMSAAMALTQSSAAQGVLRMKILRKKNWKYYDSTCYSIFTDDLPVNDNVIKLDKTDSLKAHKIISFRREIENGGRKRENT